MATKTSISTQSGHEGNGAVNRIQALEGAARESSSAGNAQHRNGLVQNGSAGASPSRIVRRRRKAWQPEQRDHLIYQWIRFEGKRQWWVASQLEIDQATVSRTLMRYEKWLAHAQPGADGQLDTAERQRVQRWLTYERNEQILTSALRIAGEMEGFTDVSKSVITRPLGAPSAEHEMRTVHATLDRSGVAARFLRLAFRINMEQLKLVEMEPLEPLAEWVDDEEADSESKGEAIAEGASGRGGEGEMSADRFSSSSSSSSSSSGGDSGPASAVQAPRRNLLVERRRDEVAANALERIEDEEEDEDENDAARKSQRLNLHHVHNGRASQNGASHSANGTYTKNGSPGKKSQTCIADAPTTPSESPDPEHQVLQLPMGLVMPGGW